MRHMTSDSWVEDNTFRMVIGMPILANLGNNFPLEVRCSAAQAPPIVEQALIHVECRLDLGPTDGQGDLVPAGGVVVVHVVLHNEDLLYVEADWPGHC